MFLDDIENKQLEPAPMDGVSTEVIEAEAVDTKDNPSLLFYLFSGAVLGYLILKLK